MILNVVQSPNYPNVWFATNLVGTVRSPLFVDRMDPNGSFAYGELMEFVEQGEHVIYYQYGCPHLLRCAGRDARDCGGMETFLTSNFDRIAKS